MNPNSNDNGLRDENGALIGGLDALDYSKGFEDFNAGIAPPDFTSHSYDLGRQLAARRTHERSELMARLRREAEESDAKMKEILPPTAYAEYLQQMKKIDAPWRRDATP